MKRTVHLGLLGLLLVAVAVAAAAAAMFAFAIVTGGFAKPGRDLFGLLLCGLVIGAAVWGGRLFRALRGEFTPVLKRRLLRFYAVVAVGVWGPWFLLGLDGSRRLQQELMPLCFLFLVPLVVTALTAAGANGSAVAGLVAFRARAAEWLAGDGGMILFLSRPGVAGTGEFEYCADARALDQRLATLPPGTHVRAFRMSILSLQGRVEEGFLERCLGEIPDGADWTVVERQSGAGARQIGGVSLLQLRAALAQLAGREVLVGPDPSGLPDGPSVISGQTP